MSIISFLSFFPAFMFGVLVAHKFEDYFFGIKDFPKYNGLICWSIFIGIFCSTMILAIVLLLFNLWLFKVCGIYDHI